MNERKQLYADCIQDVAMELSLDRVWRSRIFSLQPGGILRLSAADGDTIPAYIRETVTANSLAFEIQVVEECEESFDAGLVIFQFTAAEYPEIRAYSGNNPQVI